MSPVEDHAWIVWAAALSLITRRKRLQVMKGQSHMVNCAAILDTEPSCALTTAYLRECTLDWPRISMCLYPAYPAFVPHWLNAYWKQDAFSLRAGFKLHLQIRNFGFVWVFLRWEGACAISGEAGCDREQ